MLNVLRLLIENNKISDIQNYKEKLKDIDKFDFKKYKSSQYRKMGKDIYAKYFENAIWFNESCLLTKNDYLICFWYFILFFQITISHKRF